MKYAIIFFFSSLLLFSCGQNRPLPDVSGIKINLTTQRFEKDLFAVDTLQIDRSMNVLHQQYPGFTADFVFNILGSAPQTASADIRSFISSYQYIYASSNKTFNDIHPIESAIKKGFQYVQYHFPEYKLPVKLITFIGPINSFGCILTQDAIAVGLQLFLGKDHPIYQSEQGQALYPAFVSRKFQPEYIPVNVLKNIIDDMYPSAKPGKPMIEQMVESGKRLYMLDQFLPHIEDSLKTGYTQAQLEGCIKNEKNIWSMFIQNDLLYKIDPQIIRDYLNDAPYTQALGEGSPGNIGQFTGWQIVKKWMEKHPKTSLKELMEKDPAQLFNEAKYKPS